MNGQQPQQPVQPGQPGQSGQQKVNIKVDDVILKGRYANNMMVAHTKEEFVLDFINLFPPQGMLVSRVVTSPGHMKRIVAAFADNLKKYEDKFGKIEVAKEPGQSEIGFNTK